ncbi:amidohydrolase family protein [Mesorhizobium xinjiangense]|uniref:amidohydrolase family protein n=1 Tax=Mesorhizobium xinjiangense TaxID=2678685 RepID=UPI0012EEC85C|nr:amidohydrolase family protein [Mesorhizobium xinjiangense]
MTRPDVIFENARLADGRSRTLAVSSGYFISPDQGSAADGARRIDLGGGLVLPGLVDGHIHLDKSFLGGPWRPHRACTAEFSVRERVQFEKEELAQVADVRSRAAALIQRVVSRGTSQVRCHVDIDPEIGLASLEAICEIRERYKHVLSIQIVAFPQSGIVTAPGTADLLDAALRQGADLIGGLDPAGFDRDVNGHLDVVFGLAERHGVDVDIHLHDPDHLGLFELDKIARRTVALGMQGSVAVSHAYGLGQVAPDMARRAGETLAGAGVAIMTNAPGDHAFPPVRLLADAGVLVFAGNDNIRDAWWPYGDGDMLERAMLVGYRSGFNTDEDLELAFAMTTANAARALRLPAYGLEPGAPADFFVVDAENIPEVVTARPARQQVYKAGTLVAENGAFCAAESS